MLAVAAVAEPVPPVVAAAAGQLVQLELVASAAPGPPLLAGGQPVPTGRCPLASVVPAAVGQLLPAVGQPVPTGWAAEGQPAQLVSWAPKRGAFLTFIYSTFQFDDDDVVNDDDDEDDEDDDAADADDHIGHGAEIMVLMTSSTKAQTKERISISWK